MGCVIDGGDWDDLLLELRLRVPEFPGRRDIRDVRVAALLDGVSSGGRTSGVADAGGWIE